MALSILIVDKKLVFSVYLTDVLLVFLATEMAEVAEPLVDGGKGELDVLAPVDFHVYIFPNGLLGLVVVAELVHEQDELTQLCVRV